MAGQRAARICLDARLADGAHGGVQQVILGLAAGFSELSDGAEEYVFLTEPGAAAWLLPYLGGRCRALPARGTAELTPAARSLPAALRRACHATNALWPGGRLGLYGLRHSDGTIEGAGADLMHFTLQDAFVTALPSLYMPHDLQHLHLPRHFGWRRVVRRDLVYRAFCGRAALVVAMTHWGKRDLCRRYRLSPGKVAVIPWAPVLPLYPAPVPDGLARMRERLALPERFVFYPAQTWPHKNHMALVRALALLRRERGLSIPLVCSGTLDTAYPAVEREAARLDVADLVRFVGFVDPGDVRGLYAAATAMVFPSRFEGYGLPLDEAFEAGVPVACSRTSCLPERGGDAVLGFDPDDPADLAAAIERLWTDAALRERLVAAGARRVARHSWQRTARLFRAHYRRILGQTLGAEDRALIAETLGGGEARA